MYATLENNVKTSVQPPKKWDETTALLFVRAVVHNVMGRQVADEDDLFEYGCDRYVVCST
jgi:hypothetical protein